MANNNKKNTVNYVIFLLDTLNLYFLVKHTSITFIYNLNNLFGIFIYSIFIVEYSGIFILYLL